MNLNAVNPAQKNLYFSEKLNKSSISANNGVNNTNQHNFSYRSSQALKHQTLFKLSFKQNPCPIANFHKVNDKLYRSAQPDTKGLKYLAKLGVKTVVNLRDYRLEELPQEIQKLMITPHSLKKTDPKTAELKDYFESIHNPGFAHYLDQKLTSEELGMNWRNIPMSARRNPTEEQIGEFLDIFQYPEQYPVLVHCREGKDRTGIMSAIYEYENMPEEYGHNLDKIYADMLENGYHAPERINQSEDKRAYPNLKKFLWKYADRKNNAI